MPNARPAPPVPPPAPAAPAPSPLSKAVFRTMVATDLYGFARFLYRHLEDQNQLTPGLHQPLCNWVQTTPYAENLYLLFRGAFKTSLITVARTIQRLLAPPGSSAFQGRPHGPNTRTLICSNKSDNAEPMLGEIQQHLQNDVLLWAFPEVLGPDPHDLPEWTKSGITVFRPNRTLRGSSIRAVGVTGELTSQHYDHGTFDDVVGKENSQTKEMRESTIDFMKKTRPLFDPGATRDYLGTRWHHADFYDALLTQRRAGTPLGLYQLAAWEPCPAGDALGADVAGYGWRRPTFPERFTMAWLLGERKQIGSADFASQYLLDPVSSETAHFRREKLDVVDTCPPFEDLWIAITVDPAISTRKYADYAALAVGGFDMTGDLWLLELRRLKRNEHELVRAVYELASHYPRLKAVGFEAVGFQKTYRTLFEIEGRRRQHFLPAVKLERDTHVTKAIRIGGLQAPWEAGQIHALKDCRDLDAFRDEADKFRPDRESAHDDLLDAVADLYQVRGRPGGGTPRPAGEDTEMAERREFEEATLRRQPELDRLSVRAAWGHHLRREAERRERIEHALGAGRQEELVW